MGHKSSGSGGMADPQRLGRCVREGVWVRVPPSAQITNKKLKLWKAGQTLRDYLYIEFTYNTIKKYYKYFDEWYENITETQRLYFEAYMNGSKTPYVVN